MKNSIHFFLTSILIFAFQFSAIGQITFSHKSISNNIELNGTKIDHPSCNNNPNAFLIVTQNYKGAYNPKFIGTYYDGNKWRIVNQLVKDHMPPLRLFNVLVIDPTKLNSNSADAFTLTTNQRNTSGHITTINHLMINNDPNIKLFISYNFGKVSEGIAARNNHPIGVFYENGRWKVFNADLSPMPNNAKFNILAIKSNASETALGPSIIAKTARHKVSSNSLVPLKESISQTSLKEQNSFVFATKNGKTPKHISPFGVYFRSGKWSIINQDKSKLLLSTTFNVLNIINKSPSTTITIPILISDDALSSYFYK